MALIRYKWRHVGCYAYFLSLLFYSVFLAALTSCILLTPVSYSVLQIMELSSFKGNE